MESEEQKARNLLNLDFLRPNPKKFAKNGTYNNLSPMSNSRKVSDFGYNTPPITFLHPSKQVRELLTQLKGVVDEKGLMKLNQAYNNLSTSNQGNCNQIKIIEKVDLYNIPFGDVGARIIALGLQNSKKIVQLSISKNFFNMKKVFAKLGQTEQKK